MPATYPPAPPRLPSPKPFGPKTLRPDPPNTVSRRVPGTNRKDPSWTSSPPKPSP